MRAAHINRISLCLLFAVVAPVLAAATEDQNAATRYIRASKLFYLENTYFDSLPLYRLPLTLPQKWYGDELIKWMERAVKDNQEPLRLFHEAARCAYCRFPKDPRHARRQIPHRVIIKWGIKLLGLDALLAVNLRDGERAARDLLDALAAAQSVRDEADYLSQSLRGGQFRFLADIMEQVLGYRVLDKAQLAALQEAFVQADEIEMMARALEAEWRRQAHRPWHRYGRIALRDRRIAYRQVIDSLRTSMPEALRIARPLYDSMRRLHLASAVEQEALKLVAIRAVVIALAAEQFRLESGRLPDTLDELAPAYLPKPLEDPYTGQPLCYRKTENGFVVYSMYRNQRDDGGKYNAERLRPHDPDSDFVFWFPEPDPTEKLEVRDVHDGPRLYL